MTHSLLTEEKPFPPQSSLSAPYWQAARSGKLVVQKCTACGKLRHYPTLLCPSCHATSVDWVPLSGRGRIHSWTVTHHAFHPAFRELLPLTLVTVDMDEGVRALGVWRGSELKLGQLVQARFVVDGQRADLEFDPVHGQSCPINASLI